jgi:hypothetical protein
LSGTLNIGSHDQSSNVAVEGDIFGTLKAKLEPEVADREALKKLIAAVDE